MTTQFESRYELAEQLGALGANGTLILCDRTAFSVPDLDEHEPPPCGYDQTTIELPQAEIERVRALVDGVARLSDTRAAAAISTR